MTILLPVAGISINLFVVVGAGAVVGFLSGLLGVGGGFLLTPILMMLGVPATVAAASDTNAIVATSASGMAAHFRLGNVDLKLGCILLLGGLTGSAVGVQIIKFFRVLGNADFVISLTYVFVLGAIGSYMFVESLQSLRRGALAPKAAGRKTGGSILGRLPFQMQFPRSGIQHSVFVPFVLCSMVGILAAVMGVGGGFIMVPMMVYLLRMPMHVAIGTDLFQILFTCAGLTTTRLVPASITLTTRLFSTPEEKVFLSIRMLSCLVAAAATLMNLSKAICWSETRRKLMTPLMARWVENRNLPVTRLFGARLPMSSLGNSGPFTLPVRGRPSASLMV